MHRLRRLRTRQHVLTAAERRRNMRAAFRVNRRYTLSDARVLLLDDALSAVDAETETHILNALRARHGQRTTLVIAHRLSTLAHADCVIVLDQGRIIQQGTHAELIQQEGLYRRIWNIQHAQALEAGLDDLLDSVVQPSKNKDQTSTTQPPAVKAAGMDL